MAIVVVTTPSGEKYPVRDTNAKKYYEARKKEYMKKYKFEHQADLDMLHELLMCYVNKYELQEQLNQIKFDINVDSDEDENGINPSMYILMIKRIHESVKDYNKQIVNLQESLAINARSRDKDKDVVSLQAYITKLMRRAKYFKHSRDMQAKKAREIIMEIKTMLRINDACNDEEKEVVKIRSESEIIEKIKDMIKEYDEIDIPVKKEQESWGVGGDDW